MVSRLATARKIGVVTGLVAGTSGALFAYTLYDPVFRSKVEHYVPQSKEFFDIFKEKFELVPRSERRGKEPSKFLDDVLPPWMSRKKSQEIDAPILSIEPLPPLIDTPHDPVEVEAVDIQAAPDVTIHQRSDADLKLIKNQELENSLKAAILSSTSIVQTASDAKLRTVAAINQHALRLKANVDRGVEAQWSEVTNAAEDVEASSINDMHEERNARNYLDSVKKIINDGKSSKLTHNNPLLVNASQTVNKLTQQLDEMNSLIKKAHNDSLVLNQYKELVEKSRQEFALELKSILPNIDVHAKDSKLTEDELNALIAHAHLRVDQLRRQLAEQQAREEQNIASAIERQRTVDALHTEEQINLKLNELKAETECDAEQKIVESRVMFETNLEDRLKRAAAAHAEHLEQVIRTQRQLFDIEQSQKVKEAVDQERSLHSYQIDVAQAKLEGIETALKSRVAADLDNRRSKQLWIACHNLVDSITYGRKGGYTCELRKKPLASELQIIKEASNDDEFVICLLNALPNESIYEGVYTLDDLKTRFNKVYKVSCRVSKIDENGGGIMRYVTSFLQNAVKFDFAQNFSKEDKFDPSSIETCEILARTKYLLQNDDLDSAIRMCQLLRGEPARIAHDWIRDARRHLETRLIAEILMAHAAVTNIRAVY